MNQSHGRPKSGFPEPRYANYFTIGHNALEFVLDFGSEDGPPTVHTRIVTNPVYAKVLMRLLTESINRFEETFGPISQHDGEPESDN